MEDKKKKCTVDNSHLQFNTSINGIAQNNNNNNILTILKCLFDLH